MLEFSGNKREAKDIILHDIIYLLIVVTEWIPLLDPSFTTCLSMHQHLWLLMTLPEAPPRTRMAPRCSSGGSDGGEDGERDGYLADVDAFYGWD